MSPSVIAIVGAGFCGAMTACQLIAQQRGPLQLLLIDVRAAHGRGAAYQDLSEVYVLNVPARRMGAYAGEPGQFWDWLQQHAPGQYAPDAFVPRRLYGTYLESLLEAAGQRASSGSVSLERLRDRVTGARPDAGRIRLELAGGESRLVDRVVLATGNQPPAHPRLESGDVTPAPWYIQNPWQAACLRDLDPQRPVMLLGSGLTMVDLSLGLRHSGFSGPIIAISPHGYIPVPHQPGPAWPDFLAGRPWPASLSQWLRLLRTQAAAAEAAGVNWRAVIDALRPHAIAIWQSLSLSERRRFLRHLRHRWGVLRHRLPAEVAARIQTWIDDGSLQIRAGRVLRLDPDDAGVRVTWAPRLSDRREQFTAQRVINCTGPDGNYLALDDPLYASLRAQGLLSADPLGLGLAADPSGALLDAAGQASEWLYSLGPPLRGLYWEATAVPELREQARQLAITLATSLVQAAASAPRPHGI